MIQRLTLFLLFTVSALHAATRPKIDLGIHTYVWDMEATHRWDNIELRLVIPVGYVQAAAAICQRIENRGYSEYVPPHIHEEGSCEALTRELKELFYQ